MPGSGATGAVTRQLLALALVAARWAPEPAATPAAAAPGVAEGAVGPWAEEDPEACSVVQLPRAVAGAPPSAPGAGSRWPLYPAPPAPAPAADRAAAALPSGGGGAAAPSGGGAAALALVPPPPLARGGAPPRPGEAAPPRRRGGPPAPGPPALEGALLLGGGGAAAPAAVGVLSAAAAGEGPPPLPDVVEPVVLGPEAGPPRPQDAALLQEGPAGPPPTEAALLQQQNAELVRELAEAQATSAALLREDTRLQRESVELRRLLNATNHVTNDDATNVTHSGYHEITLSGARRNLLKPVSIGISVVLAFAIVCWCTRNFLLHRHRLAQRDRNRQNQARRGGAAAASDGGAEAAIGQAADTSFLSAVLCSGRVCVMAAVVGVFWGSGLAIMWMTGSLQPVLKEAVVYAYLALGIGSFTMVFLLGLILHVKDELQGVGNKLSLQGVGHNLENAGSSFWGQSSPAGTKK